MKVSAKARRALRSAARPSSFSCSIVSILFSTRIFGALQLRQLFENRLDFLVHALARVDQQADDVGVARPAPGGRDHGAVEPALRRENARRIDEDDLRRAFERDAAHQGARRLHLARDDRDFGADQLVEQRRFAGVGRADQGDEAATRGSCRASLTRFRFQTPSRDRNFCGAGLFGEAFRTALARGRLEAHDRNLDDESGAWSGPDRARTGDRMAAAGRAPAPIPAARSWDRARAARD